MKNIIVLIPTESESRVLVRRGVRVRHCGAGMAECASTTASLIADGKPDLMILAGTAGTYTDDIVIGETVIVESETIGDLGRWSEVEHERWDFTPLFQRTYTASVIPESVRRGLRTVRSYTTNTAGGYVTKPVRAEIENMEGAAFFAVCEKMGVPAMEIRTVSNRVGQPITGKNMEIATGRLALDLEEILSSLKHFVEEPIEQTVEK